jgi:hypothetical protein
MSAKPDAVELILALQELRSVHGVSTTYQRLWAAVVNGQAPALRVGRRWMILRADLPRVAAALDAALPAAA